MAGVSTYLCFDYGLKNIGVAVGNTLTQEARPLVILSSAQGKPSWIDISNLISDWQPSGVIVGHPIGEDGETTELSAKASKFARQIEGRFKLNVALHDERFSSKEAKLRAKDLGHKGDYVKHPIDDLAAAIILESWLAGND